MINNGAVGTVQRMFEAFRAGHVDSILATVDPASRWTYIGANPKPTKAELIGHDNIRRFFERIIRRLEMSSFETTEFVQQNNTLVVFGSESGTVRSTGAAFRNEWVQKYVVDVYAKLKAGQITGRAVLVPD